MPTVERLAADAYADHVNPQWVKLLNLLEMNVSYERCVGTELFSANGRRTLDFLSGYCVHNAGHNHPAIVAALKDELDKSGPVMLQSNVPEVAGELAERLCKLAGGGLSKVFFASSGSEGVETAIKFARAIRRRSPNSSHQSATWLSLLTTPVRSGRKRSAWRGGRSRREPA